MSRRPAAPGGTVAINANEATRVYSFAGISIPSGPANTPPQTCILCGDEKLRRTRLRDCPCGHLMCTSCINSFFTSRARIRPHQPPTCCNRALPMDWGKEFLRPREWITFRDMHEEQLELRKAEDDERVAAQEEGRAASETLPVPNHYCHRQECRKYIPKRHRRRDFAVCSCSARVCLGCGEEEHAGYTCDEAVGQRKKQHSKERKEERRKLGKDPDRKRLELLKCRYCPYCVTVIEKWDGCDHMLCTTCRNPFSWAKAKLFKANGSPPKPTMAPTNRHW